jgi:hypothetical protein
MMAMEADSARRATSLSAPVGDADGAPLSDQLGDEDALLERAADRSPSSSWCRTYPSANAS